MGVPLTREGRFRRRLVTIPALLLAGLAWVLLAPILLPCAIAVNVSRPPARRSATATVLSIGVWIGLVVVLVSSVCAIAVCTAAFASICDVCGLLTAAVLWSARGIGLIRSEAAYLKYHFALQYYWGKTILTAVFWLFKLRIDIEGADELGRGGPVIVFMRHVSIIDVLLPASQFFQPLMLNLRYLVKKENLYLPVLDVVGHRLPNVFVDRSGTQRENMRRSIKALVNNLGPRDGVLIYPEGTRYTKARRQRLIEKLENQGDSALLDQARSLQNLLPARIGGAQACFDGAPDADVLIVGHVGLEGAASPKDLWHGVLYDTEVTVRIWRVPVQKIPASLDARVQWLATQWKALDVWVTEQYSKR